MRSTGFIADLAGVCGPGIGLLTMLFVALVQDGGPGAPAGLHCSHKEPSEAVPAQQGGGRWVSGCQEANEVEPPRPPRPRRDATAPRWRPRPSPALAARRPIPPWAHIRKRWPTLCRAAPRLARLHPQGSNAGADTPQPCTLRPPPPPRCAPCTAPTQQRCPHPMPRLLPASRPPAHTPPLVPAPPRSVRAGGRSSSRSAAPDGHASRASRAFRGHVPAD